MYGDRCPPGRRRRWGDNLARVLVLVAGVDPIARGTVGAVDDAWSRGMSGHAGTTRIGDSAAAEFRFLGYFPFQRLSVIPLGAVPAIRNPMTALPATHGDVRTVGATMTVQQLLANSTLKATRR